MFRELDEVFLKILVLLEVDANSKELLVENFEKIHRPNVARDMGLFLTIYNKYSFLLVRLEFHKENNPKFFEKQKEDLKKQKERLVFFGFKFEIDIAYSLSLKGVKFTSPDPPDFDITGRDCMIECTTAISRIKERRKDRLLKKVLDKLKEKEGNKMTAVPNCALFLETTNLLKHAVEFAQEFYNLQCHIVETHMNHQRFGAILVFNFIAEKFGNYNLVYWRKDSNNIQPELKEFLDDHYPFQPKKNTKRPLLPEFG